MLNSVNIVEEITQNLPPSMQTRLPEIPQNYHQRWQWPGCLHELSILKVLILKLTNAAFNVAPVVGRALIKFSQFVELLWTKESWASTSAKVASTTEAPEKRNAKKYLMKTIADSIIPKEFSLDRLLRREDCIGPRVGRSPSLLYCNYRCRTKFWK